MPSLITDRRTLLKLAAQTQRIFEEGAPATSHGELEQTGSPLVSVSAQEASVYANAIAAARQTETDSSYGTAALESVDAATDPIPYLPSNQTLSLLQSAYDEYLAGKAVEADVLEMPFDTSDPGWLTIAAEKLKALFRGKRPFIPHTGLDSFQYDLPPNATVALFSDWGTAEPTARRVMEQIRAAAPTHAVHLGDVYYSGTPHEVQTRFLDVIRQFGPSHETCRYFALNANHDMYSGGYGYFDTALPAIGQDASYFNLRNQNWQLIGLDSGYDEHGLHDPQKEWLAAQLQTPAARSICLSHHQLFSPYESRAVNRDLAKKTADLLTRIHAWFWGHEHRCIVFGNHLGIKARCIGHGAIPTPIPFGTPKFPAIPILRVDERPSPDGLNIHGFALLRFNGPRLDVSYVDEFGVEFFAERLDSQTPPVFFFPQGQTEAILDRSSVINRQARLMQGSSASSVEAVGDGPPELDLSQSAIDDRIAGTRAALHQVVKELLGDGADLHEIADQIALAGRSALTALSRAEPLDGARGEQILSTLEVIVRTDGSRPSFMVRDGAVDLTTSPAGTWKDQIVASPGLQAGLSCVGRIDLPGVPQGFVGTGFLIQDNLIVTNRHVLQSIGRPDPAGVWTLKPGAVIDFGHEFRARDSVSPRVLKRVVFCASKVIIPSSIDHSKLDLVIIELEAASEAERPLAVLAFDIAPDWASPDAFIYTVGYPADPGLGEQFTLLELLFQSTFGCKRLAPGTIQTARSSVAPWTLAHDATTLGGNSGSVVLRPGKEGVAAGLHYGGTRLDPRENWGHVLGRVLDEPDRVSGKSLRDVLKAFHVQLIDRTVRN